MPKDPLAFEQKVEGMKGWFAFEDPGDAHDAVVRRR